MTEASRAVWKAGDKDDVVVVAVDSASAVEKRAVVGMVRAVGWRGVVKAWQAVVRYSVDNASDEIFILCIVYTVVLTDLLCSELYGL